MAFRATCEIKANPAQFAGVFTRPVLISSQKVRMRIKLSVYFCNLYQVDMTNDVKCCKDFLANLHKTRLQVFEHILF